MPASRTEAALADAIQHARLQGQADIALRLQRIADLLDDINARLVSAHAAPPPMLPGEERAAQGGGAGARPQL